MSNTLFYRPGETGTIVFETYDGYGVRADRYPTPVVSRVILPEFLDDDGYLALSDGYPQSMTQLDTGLFYYKFILPTGGSAVGTYIFDITYEDPSDNVLKKIAYQIIAQSVSGNIGLKVSQ